jgi:hypothetical protein
MNLIDCSYFYSGPLAIENARNTDDLNNNAAAVQEAITGYIEHYQGEYLSKMVGDGVANVITDHLAAVEAYENAVAEAQEGETVEPYVNDAAELLCSKLRESFAHYVYFKMVGDVNQTMTVTGLMRIKSANDNQSPRQRMVSVWNHMVDINRRFVKWAETSNYEVFYHVNMVTPINQFNI